MEVGAGSRDGRTATSLGDAGAQAGMSPGAGAGAHKGTRVGVGSGPYDVSSAAYAQLRATLAARPASAARSPRSARVRERMALESLGEPVLAERLARAERARARADAALAARSARVAESARAEAEMAAAAAEAHAAGRHTLDVAGFAAAARSAADAAAAAVEAAHAHVATLEAAARADMEAASDVRGSRSTHISDRGGGERAFDKAASDAAIAAARALAAKLEADSAATAAAAAETAVVAHGAEGASDGVALASRAAAAAEEARAAELASILAERTSSKASAALLRAQGLLRAKEFAVAGASYARVAGAHARVREPAERGLFLSVDLLRRAHARPLIEGRRDVFVRTRRLSDEEAAALNEADALAEAARAREELEAGRQRQRRKDEREKAARRRTEAESEAAAGMAAGEDGRSQGQPADEMQETQQAARADAAATAAGAADVATRRPASAQLCAPAAARSAQSDGGGPIGHDGSRYDGYTVTVDARTGQLVAPLTVLPSSSARERKRSEVAAHAEKLRVPRRRRPSLGEQRRRLMREFDLAVSRLDIGDLVPRAVQGLEREAEVRAGGRKRCTAACSTTVCAPGLSSARGAPVRAPTSMRCADQRRLAGPAFCPASLLPPCPLPAACVPPSHSWSQLRAVANVLRRNFHDIKRVMTTYAMLGAVDASGENGAGGGDANEAFTMNREEFWRLITDMRVLGKDLPKARAARTSVRRASSRPLHAAARVASARACRLVGPAMGAGRGRAARLRASSHAFACVAVPHRSTAHRRAVLVTLLLIARPTVTPTHCHPRTERRRHCVRAGELGARPGDRRAAR